MSRNDFKAIGADRARRSKDGDPLSLLMIGIHQDKDSHSESDKRGQFAATLVSYFNCTLPHAVPHSRYRVRDGQESSAEIRIRRGLYQSYTIRRATADTQEFPKNSCSIRTPDTWTKSKCDGWNYGPRNPLSVSEIYTNILRMKNVFGCHLHTGQKASHLDRSTTIRIVQFTHRSD